jgi:hypothetical protein
VRAPKPSASRRRSASGPLTIVTDLGHARL